MNIKIEGNMVTGVIRADYSVSRDETSSAISRNVAFNINCTIEQLVDTALQSAIIRAQAADRRALRKGESFATEFDLVAKPTVSKLIYVTADEFREKLSEVERAALASMPDDVLRVFVNTRDKTYRIK